MGNWFLLLFRTNPLDVCLFDGSASLNFRSNNNILYAWIITTGVPGFRYHLSSATVAKHHGFSSHEWTSYDKIMARHPSIHSSNSSIHSSIHPILFFTLTSQHMSASIKCHRVLNPPKKSIYPQICGISIKFPKYIARHHQGFNNASYILIRSIYYKSLTWMFWPLWARIPLLFTTFWGERSLRKKSQSQWRLWWARRVRSKHPQQFVGPMGFFQFRLGDELNGLTMGILLQAKG